MMKVLIQEELVGFMIPREGVLGLSPQNTQDIFKEKSHTTHQEITVQS